MHKFTQKPSVWDHFLGFQQSIASRIVWPYSFEKDSLVRWRANILSSILIAGLIMGVIAFAAAAALIVKKNAWGLAFVDSLGFVLCLVFLFVHRIRYEIRAAVSLLMFYVIGMAIILSVGPLSGGPAWLFAFAVIAGVLMGNTAAFAAIIINALSLGLISILFLTGRWGHDVVFFTSPQAMAAAGVNFIGLNAITAVSVSTLVKGLFQLSRKKEELAAGLETERSQLIQTKHCLESEVKERKSAEARLQENQKLLAQITRYTSALVSIHDAEGRYVFASTSHEKLGYHPRDLVGKSGSTMVAKADKAYLLENLEKAKSKKISSVFLDYRLMDTRGKMHFYRGSFDAVSAPDGSLEQIICVGEDITEMRKIQAEKIQALTLAAEAQKLALVGQVAGKMAHDFNNILGVIMGTTELAMLDCPHEQTRASLRLIFDQTIQGKNITENLVVFARDQELKQELSAFDGKITGAGSETFITNKHILVVEDEPAISDVQSRILSQAPCHHTVDTAEDGPSALEFLAEKQYDLISLDYILPGDFTGMDIYRHIREINKTVPILFISGNIEFLESIRKLQQKDPHIDHVSKPCMNMDYVKRVNQLLLHQDSGISPETGQTPEPRAVSLVQERPKNENPALLGGDEHILLVDDEKTIVELETLILEGLGYTITSFTDSRKAAEEFQADPDRFDLVITDMAMPQMTGAKLAGEMIAIRSDIPIIMCTGFSDRISEETAKHAGIKKLLMKPVAMSDLACAVRKVLDEPKK